MGETLGRSAYHHLVQPGSMGKLLISGLLMAMLVSLSLEYSIKSLRTSSSRYGPRRLDLSRTASLDPTDGQSFAALGCTGNYDKSSFSALQAVCESCYQLYREPEVHSLCRSNCFTSSYFTQCLASLLLNPQGEHYSRLASRLG